MNLFRVILFFLIFFLTLLPSLGFAENVFDLLLFKLGAVLVAIVWIALSYWNRGKYRLKPGFVLRDHLKLMKILYTLGIAMAILSALFSTFSWAGSRWLLIGGMGILCFWSVWVYRATERKQDSDPEILDDLD